ncbi:MAG TPA: PEP/pyruvate-binding domain-containing protein [Sedimentisphaerales bacterium]|nr:PEP/pyruvate-binding domain-containing protein [Sedimentisphaerales bacterium]
MNQNRKNIALSKWAVVLLLAASLRTLHAQPPIISPSPYWKNQLVYPYDTFCNSRFADGKTKWIKFTILLEPYDPSVVYFQDSSKYVFHYTFANEWLDPFRGMTAAQYNAATLFEKNQKAVLGAVILPPVVVWPTQPTVREYGIQLIRQDAFTREQIRDLFHLVKSRIGTPDDVQVFYFPTYEQQATATANRDWFESQGIPLSSTSRWAKGNTCYSQGWAFGRVNFIPAGEIASAYHSGRLKPTDILLTDGVPAEVPFVAGIISLAPSTPNSHVAILAKTYMVPFIHLALAADAQRIQTLIGSRIVFTAYENDFGVDVWIADTEGLLDEVAVGEILELRKPAPLNISPTASLGAFGVSTEGLLTEDIRYVGGKAANFSLLRAVVPENSPYAVALTFDLWKAFLDQPLAPVAALALMHGEHMLFWADDQTEQGPTHAGFKLSKDGETLCLFDADGATLLDSIEYGPQTSDVSYARSVDGGDTWEASPTPTPGGANSPLPGAHTGGLVINEFMADNEQTLEDPVDPGDYPDWIELYNASDETIVLNGLYLTDDITRPTLWQIPSEIAAPTLRDEIARRLSDYTSYPPADMQRLSRDLASIRSLFTGAGTTEFDDALREGVIDVLTDPVHGFDPSVPLRFRSSTNVEDSVDFIGAGLYDSFSGCLADALDGDDDGPCACDPNRKSEKDIFQAIRQVFASFYNDNAYLERLRHGLNESDVGMAVVVHHSFPDEIELANGVATMQRNGPAANTAVSLVTQLGAVSVTNPEGGSIPEEVSVTILPSGSSAWPEFKQASSLVRLGETVMAGTLRGKSIQGASDYMDLTNLLLKVGGEFERITGRQEYILDLEYKKVAPGGRVLPEGGLVVKQVRQVPSSDRMQTPYLVNQPTQFEVYTGEVELMDAVDVFADHRLKSRWTIQTRNTVLDSNALSESLYTDVQIEYLDGDTIRTISGSMASLPEARHSAYGDDTVDTWELRDLANPRAYRLRTTDVPMEIPPSQRPIFASVDLGGSGYRVPYRFLTLNVDYANPVMSWHPLAMRYTTTNRVYLWATPPAGEGDLPQERTLTYDGVTIQSYFYYPPLPAGLTEWELGGGNTAPLKRWDHTRIEGLTAQPIVLKGYYSQTFRPEHHNLVEHFLFEPRVEPGISAEILDQLQAKGIRFLHMILDKDGVGANDSRIIAYNFSEIPTALTTVGTGP